MGVMEGVTDLRGNFRRRCKRCNGPLGVFATYCDKPECQEQQAKDPEIDHGE
jgi:hypothetical protein